MLQTLLAYGRGAGLDIRWLVIQGDAGFFEITKRIHNGLYGSLGDGGALGRPSGATTSRRCAVMPKSCSRSSVPETSS